MGSEFEISEPVQVEREDTQVMFMRATADTAEEIQKAWAHVEAAVELSGRKFFGAFDVSVREYRFCAELKMEAPD